MTPPVDTDGELERASLALRRMRRELDKAELPSEWQAWVAESLAAPYREPDDTK